MFPPLKLNRILPIALTSAIIISIQQIWNGVLHVAQPYVIVDHDVDGHERQRLQDVKRRRVARLTNPRVRFTSSESVILELRILQRYSGKHLFHLTNQIIQERMNTSPLIFQYYSISICFDIRYSMKQS
eukprot:g14659.t1 g14659   contig90:104770-105256(-)